MKKTKKGRKYLPAISKIKVICPTDKTAFWVPYYRKVFYCPICAKYYNVGQCKYIEPGVYDPEDPFSIP